MAIQVFNWYQTDFDMTFNLRVTLDLAMQVHPTGMDDPATPNEHSSDIGLFFYTIILVVFFGLL